MVNKKSFFFILLLLTINICNSQSNAIKQIENYINTNEYQKAFAISEKIIVNKLSPLDIAKYNFLMAKLSIQNNKDDLAYRYFIQAREKFIAIDSSNSAAQTDFEIVSLLLARNENKVDYNPYLNRYIEFARQQQNPDYLSKSYFQIGKSFYDTIPLKALSYFKKAEKENLKTNDHLFHGRILMNMGATYAHDGVNKLDSALVVYDKSLLLFNKENAPEYIYYIFINKGKAYWKKKEYNKALFFYKKADSMSVKKFENKNKAILYEFMAETYKSMGDYKNTLEYTEKQNVYKEILDEKEQEIALKDIDVKYNTEQKEEENKNLKTIMYSAFSIFIVIAIISILSYKNLSKKKTIAEQEKLIETQKLETSLKEQELHEIDVMLEVQEKERQLIANELHDNLGSMLATLKHNFENLKRNDENTNDKEEALFQKTDELIEEAYQNVRNIAHLKNLGVIGSEGLVIAVKKMAGKMSVPEKLYLNVIPHGLNERLENTLEVTLFRMIQELCTNIIKHSQASEVNIYLTQHNSDELNIIIEDNGKGFDPKTIVQKSGIGLKNIEKKVEQLNGTFTIDSIISKGTTIIIDLPI